MVNTGNKVGCSYEECGKAIGEGFVFKSGCGRKYYCCEDHARKVEGMNSLQRVEIRYDSGFAGRDFQVRNRK
jgi:hypothetical protein